MSAQKGEGKRETKTPEEKLNFCIKSIFSLRVCYNLLQSLDEIVG